MRRRFGPATFLALAILLTACATPGPRSGTKNEGSNPQSVSGPKRILAAIRGDPFTLVDAINSAGGGRVAGVREVEHAFYSPRCFAMTMRCTSFVPSPISSTFWSR